MKKTPAQLLPIYRAALKRMEAKGWDQMAAIQRRLIKRLEQEKGK